jgi:hypothetical protein
VCVDALAVGGGRRTDGPTEVATEGTLVVVAALRCDRRDRGVGGFEQHECRLDAEPDDQLLGGEAEDAAGCSLELGRAHLGHLGQIGHGDRRRMVPACVLDRSCEVLVAGGGVGRRPQVHGHTHHADRVAVVVGPARLRGQEPSVGPIGSRDQFEFVRERTPRADHGVVLGLVPFGQPDREEIAGAAADHVARTRQTGPFGECLVGGQVRAVEALHAEHDPGRSGQHVDHRRQGTLVHGSIIAVPQRRRRGSPVVVRTRRQPRRFRARPPT